MPGHETHEWSIREAANRSHQSNADYTILFGGMRRLTDRAVCGVMPQVDQPERQAHTLAQHIDRLRIELGLTRIAQAWKQQATSTMRLDLRQYTLIPAPQKKREQPIHEAVSCRRCGYNQDQCLTVDRPDNDEPIKQLQFMLRGPTSCYIRQAHLHIHAIHQCHTSEKP